MYSLFFIARNNIKKHKGEAVILFILMFIASLLLYSSLTLLLSGKETIKRFDEEHHISDLLIFSPDGMSEEEALRRVASVPETDICESIPMIEWAADTWYADQTIDDALSSQLYITDCTRNTYLNSFPEEFNDLSDDEIVLPYYMSFQVGKGEPFHIRANGLDLSFTVRGYIENFYWATSMNISGYLCLVSPATYVKISDRLPEIDSSIIYANAVDGVSLKDYELAVEHAFDDDNIPSTATRDVMETATTSMSNIASSIVLVFAAVLIGLALVVMYFSIKNFIELNTQNIGLLQATGYTPRALRFACITEEMLLCIIATSLSIIAGLFLSGPLSSLQGMLIGLSGFSGICVPAMIMTVIIIPVAVFIGTFIATRSYKRLTVVESLRSGITSHNFKKNHFSLDKSRLPLSLALSGKQILGNKKKSIFIGLIIAVLTSSTLLGFTLWQNWASDTEPLLKLVGFEASDIQVYSDPNGFEDGFYEELAANEYVDHLNTNKTIMSVEASYLDNTESLGVDIYGDVNNLQYDYLLEGHFPQTGNEIVLSIVESRNLDAEIGDIINLKAADGSGLVQYTVCGIDQKINNLGEKALLNEDGGRRLDPEYKYDSILVYLKDPSMTDQLKNEWSDEYADYSVIKVDDLVGSTIATIKLAMKAICLIFVFITCFVVILTEILLTRSQVIRERTELGVSKAIGYTSGQLIRRILSSNLPVIVIGVFAGFLLHILTTNRLILIALNTFGISQNNFTTWPLWYLSTFAMIIACAVLTSLINSRSISKLEPIRILKEE